MHIFVILFSESFINSITEFAYFIFVDVIGVFTLGFFRDLYELVSYLEVLLLLLRLGSIVGFLLYGFFIESWLLSMTSFLHLLFNRLYDGWSKIFKEWLDRVVSNLSSNSCN